jgi:hypothetical protein
LNILGKRHLWSIEMLEGGQMATIYPDVKSVHVERLMMMGKRPIVSGSKATDARGTSARRPCCMASTGWGDGLISSASPNP